MFLKFFIVIGKVVEYNNICWFFVMKLIIWAMTGWNSGERSLSVLFMVSIVVWFNLVMFLFVKLMRWLGVVMMMCIGWCKCMILFFKEVFFVVIMTAIFKCFSSFFAIWFVCSVNLCVGIKMIVWMIFLLVLIFLRMGIVNVVVFFVLFFVRVKMFRFVSAMGIDFFWIGEGFLKFFLKIFIRSFFLRK